MPSRQAQDATSTVAHQFILNRVIGHKLINAHKKAPVVVATEAVLPLTPESSQTSISNMNIGTNDTKVTEGYQPSVTLTIELAQDALCGRVARALMGAVE